MRPSKGAKRLPGWGSAWKKPCSRSCCNPEVTPILTILLGSNPKALIFLRMIQSYKKQILVTRNWIWFFLMRSGQISNLICGSAVISLNWHERWTRKVYSSPIPQKVNWKETWFHWGFWWRRYLALPENERWFEPRSLNQGLPLLPLLPASFF